MNFKKNFKRFFTLSRNAEGFTLVELIVVIAILGILAVVAVPTYGSYVERSQKAVDNSQIGVINSVFSVACVSNGVEPSYFDTGVSLVWNDKVVTGIDVPEVTRTASATSTAALIEADFGTYIGAGVEFKIYTSSDITFSNGMFYGPNGETGGEGGNAGASGGVFSEKFNGFADDETFQNNVGTVKDSVFGEIGASGLMNKVNDVTGIATDLANFKNPDGSQPHANLLLQYAEDMITDLGLDETSYMSMVNSKMEELKSDGVSYADEDELFSMAQNELLANYAVLVAAKNTAGKTDAELLTTLRTEFTSSDLKGMVKNGGESMAQAAMIYGMYTAYANGLPDSDPNKAAALEKAKDPDAFLDAYADAGFQNYLKDTDGSGKVEDDLAAYKAAMGIINSGMSGEDKTAATQLVNNGFTDPELLAALEGLLG